MANGRPVYWRLSRSNFIFSRISDHAMTAPFAAPLPRALRRGFDRRAANLAQVDYLLHEIGQRMQERMRYIRLDPKRALDLGCGRGHGLAALRAQYPDAQIAGLDLSARMLHESARLDPQRGSGWIGRLLGRRPVFDLVQADYASLPFATGAFDMLWSNLALHWHPEPHLVFPEWHRVAAEGGLLMFSLFGPDTLRELRQALAGVDGRPHTLRFVDMHDIGDMLVHGGWSTPVMDMETLTITYERAETLLQDVHLMGGFAAGDGGLRSRSWLKRVHAALEAQRGADGLIKLTFEIVYGHAWKLAPAARQIPDAEGRVSIPLHSIGRGRAK
jgi:malonyl-CoA O-methyltransferase